MLPKDYIAYRLTGVFGTDYSDASGMLLLDVDKKEWSEYMLEICHITKEQLPKLYESSEKIGVIKKDLANELGFPNDVIVAAGAGDNAAAAVGTGVVGNGGCNISLGTSGTVFVSGNNFDGERNPAIHYFAHADGGFHLMGCILSAASCNRWWIEDILGESDYSEQQSKINKLGENNVFFLPYLMGERSPHNDTKVRGAFLGLTPDTTKEDMTQAVLEGVAFAIRDCFEVAKACGVKTDNSKICGGGAKSELWKRIIANVLGIRIDCAETEEGPSYGAAILAAVANGEYESVEDATKKIVKIKSSVYPEDDIVEKYNRKYKKFTEIYPAVKNLYQ
jgi:xylulokinase